MGVEVPRIQRYVNGMKMKMDEVPTRHIRQLRGGGGRAGYKSFVGSEVQKLDALSDQPEALVGSLDLRPLIGGLAARSVSLDWVSSPSPIPPNWNQKGSIMPRRAKGSFDPIPQQYEKYKQFMPDPA